MSTIYDDIAAEFYKTLPSIHDKYPYLRFTIDGGQYSLSMKIYADLYEDTDFINTDSILVGDITVYSINVLNKFSVISQFISMGEMENDRDITALDSRSVAMQLNALISKQLDNNVTIQKLTKIYYHIQGYDEIVESATRVIDAAYQLGILPEGEQYTQDLLNSVREYLLSRNEYRTLTNKYRYYLF